MSLLRVVDNMVDQCCYSSSDCFVKDIYPEGLLPHCPQNDGFCWIEMESILKEIGPPATGMGHQYILHEKTQTSITELF
jgi:hypothetical protein